MRLYKEPLQDIPSDEDDWVGKDTEATQDDLQNNDWNEAGRRTTSQEG